MLSAQELPASDGLLLQSEKQVRWPRWGLLGEMVSVWALQPESWVSEPPDTPEDWLCDHLEDWECPNRGRTPAAGDLGPRLLDSEESLV